MKTTYQVEVCRISYGFRTIEVEADSPEEAQKKARDEAGDYVFSEKSSEYTTGSVTKKETIS